MLRRPTRRRSWAAPYHERLRSVMSRNDHAWGLPHSGQNFDGRGICLPHSEQNFVVALPAPPVAGGGCCGGAGCCWAAAAFCTAFAIVWPMAIPAPRPAPIPTAPPPSLAAAIGID